ncbi:MAG: hypothetical protein H0T73_16085 [Ardenticatenales bacterium]|nr:hypothetical protein [Ardenticatenales bacterium]
MPYTPSSDSIHKGGRRIKRTPMTKQAASKEAVRRMTENPPLSQLRHVISILATAGVLTEEQLMTHCDVKDRTLRAYVKTHCLDPVHPQERQLARLTRAFGAGPHTTKAYTLGILGRARLRLSRGLVGATLAPPVARQTSRTGKALTAAGAAPLLTEDEKQAVHEAQVMEEALRLYRHGTPDDLTVVLMEADVLARSWLQSHQARAEAEALARRAEQERELERTRIKAEQQAKLAAEEEARQSTQAAAAHHQDMIANIEKYYPTIWD